MKTILFSALLALTALPAAAGQIACIYDLAGPAELQKAGSEQWLPARKGLPLDQGDRLRTGEKAWCELLFKDGSFIKMEAGSETAAETLQATPEGRIFSFSFLRGKALWMAAKLRKGAASKFSIRTPSAVCAVRGTDFSIIVSSAGETSVGLYQGEVAVSNELGEKVLLAGSEASAGPGEIALQARLSSLMKAEERRYRKIKGRVETLRRRLAEREDFIDDYVGRQEKALLDFEKRRQEKLKRR